MNRRSFVQSIGLGAVVTASLRNHLAQASPNPPNILNATNIGAPKTLGGINKTVLIVGGGLAAMSAALELAERGYKVTIREADSVLGGKLATRSLQTNAGQFEVEHGLHMWFDNYHNFADIQKRLGIQDNFRNYGKVNFVFRNYKPEALESSPAIYPLNLLALLGRSPNLNLLNAIGTLNSIAPVLLFDYKNIYKKFDNVTFAEFAKQRNVDKKFYDIIMEPAASVTLNDPHEISAAEMLMYMHLYFISQPKAMNRQVSKIDHGTAVINPWAKRLRSLGVTIQTESAVPGLRFVNNRAVGTTDSNTNFDWVILTSDVGASQRILAGSQASDAVSTKLLSQLADRINALKVAPPYKILRVWLDKKPDDSRPDIIETPEHKPITLIAQFHLLETQSQEWSTNTGGSILEFHLYNTPNMVGLADDEIWPLVRETAIEVLPELADANLIDSTVGSYHNFTSFSVGQGTIRPSAVFPLQLGIANMMFAGDWVSTAYPSALMERAVSTGREAANAALLADNVLQASLKVTTDHGPGLI